MKLGEYKDQAFNLVTKIGNVVGFPVELYVYKDGAYYQLTRDNLDSRLASTYGFTTSDGKNNVFFMVARAGQTGQAEVKSPVTCFRMYYFPGCCAFAISSAARVYEQFQSRGINKLGIQLRLALAGAFNYKALICTDTTGNFPSIKTLEGAGFTKLHATQNKRTFRTVNLYLKELP